MIPVPVASWLLNPFGSLRRAFMRQVPVGALSRIMSYGSPFASRIRTLAPVDDLYRHRSATSSIGRCSAMTLPESSGLNRRPSRLFDADARRSSPRTAFDAPACEAQADLAGERQCRRQSLTLRRCMKLADMTGPLSDQPALLMRELAAWRWARQQALTRTPAMERTCASSLAWAARNGVAH